MSTVVPDSGLHNLCVEFDTVVGPILTPWLDVKVLHQGVTSTLVFVGFGTVQPTPISPGKSNIDTEIVVVTHESIELNAFYLM